MGPAGGNCLPTGTRFLSRCDTVVNFLYDFFLKTSFPESIFLLEKDGKAPLHISYKDKVRLVAFTRQISHGPYEAARAPDVGVFNVIGNDRR